MSMSIREKMAALQKSGKLGTYGTITTNPDDRDLSPYYKEKGTFATGGYLPKRYSKVSSKVSSKVDYIDQEKQADLAQGAASEWGNAAVGFLSNSVSGFLDNLGATLNPGKIYDMFVGNVEKDYTNSLSKLAQSLREVTNEALPIYNGSESMWTSAYWANQFSQAGTTLGILGESALEQMAIGALTGGSGNVAMAGGISAKIAGLLKNVKLLNTAQKVSMYGRYAFGLGQGVKEAYINGLENLNNVYNDYKNVKGTSEAEARRAAAEAASESFKYEIIPVAVLNALLFGAFGVNKYNPFARSGGPESGFSSAVESVFSKMVPKNSPKWAKGVADWTGNALSEGAEEGFQTAAQGIGAYHTDEKHNRTEGKTLSDYIATNDMRDSVIGGFLGGFIFKGFGNIISKYKTSSSMKEHRKYMEEFLKGTVERTNLGAAALQEALKQGDLVKAEKIKKQMGYNNIEAALQIDFMKNDENMTAYNAQIEQLKEVSRIIKENDIKGLEMLGLKNEKDDTGDNPYQYLKNNIDNMIADAEAQKNSLTSNLNMQRDVTGTENFDIAQNLTRYQMMQKTNTSAIESQKKYLEELLAKDNNFEGYTDDVVELNRLNSFVEAYNTSTKKFSNSAIEKEYNDAIEKIKELKESNPEYIFNSNSLVSKAMINAQSRILTARESNFSLKNDIEKLSSVEGIRDYKIQQVKNSVNDYENINSISELEKIKDSLSKNEDVKAVFSNKELKEIGLKIDSKIAKIKATEAEAKLNKAVESAKATITEDGKANPEVVTDPEKQKKAEEAAKAIDERRASVPPLAKTEEEKSKLKEKVEKINKGLGEIVDDSNIFFEEKGLNNSAVKVEEKKSQRDIDKEEKRKAHTQRILEKLKRRLIEAKSPLEKANVIANYDSQVYNGAIFNNEDKELFENARKEIAEAGYEIADMLGKPYNEGMKVSAEIKQDDSLTPGKSIITSVKSPQINKDGKMIQAAEITVSQNFNDNNNTSFIGSQEEYVGEAKGERFFNDSSSNRSEKSLFRISNINGDEADFHVLDIGSLSGHTNSQKIVDMRGADISVATRITKSSPGRVKKNNGMWEVIKNAEVTLDGSDDIDFAPKEYSGNHEEANNVAREIVENYLDNNPKGSLRDFISSVLNSEDIDAGVVENVYYYLANNYYLAKGEKYEDNKKEINRVYKSLFEPYTLLEGINKLNNLLSEAKEVTVEEQKRVEEVVDKEIVEKQQEDSQPVAVDANGRSVYYLGPKIVAPAMKVPYSGNPYHVIYNITDKGDTEVILVRDKDAEVAEVLTGAAGQEAIKRAFMMNPHLAKAGVPIHAYIPTMQELMSEDMKFVVTKWTRNESNGALEKSTEPFSVWYEREEKAFKAQHPNEDFIGSDRFLEKVPVFSYIELNGQLVEMGSVMHETDWWNKRNVAGFENSEDLREDINGNNEERRAIARGIAQSRQQAVIDEAREKLLADRKTIWENTDRESWNNGEITTVGMKISQVTDGFSLKIPSNEPKKNLREANNDLMIGLVLANSNGEKYLAYSSEGGSVLEIPEKYIFNPSVLTSGQGFAVTLIPYAMHEDGNPMYLVQLVDTGYTGAQENLKYLFEQKTKILNLSRNYQQALKNNNTTTAERLKKELNDVFTAAKLSKEKIDSYFNADNESMSFKRINEILLDYYPRVQKNTGEDGQALYQTNIRKENLSGDIASIVVFDEQGKPIEYKPNSESEESSYVQMLKETIYTNNDYIEIRDLRSEDHNATIKVANAQPRVHIVFDNETTEKKIQQRNQEAAQKQQEEAKKEVEKKKEETPEETIDEVKDEAPKFVLTSAKKYTIVNHLFNKILNTLQDDKLSKRDIALAIRKAIENHLQGLKESNPELYQNILDNKDEILGLGEYENATMTVREAILNHFNMENIEEIDDAEIDKESSMEKDHSKLSQEYNVKTSLSSRLKRVFSSIPVQNKYRKGEFIEGITEYMELDDVFSALQDLLADAPNDFTVLQERVREKINLNSSEFGFLQNIADILGQLDTQLQSEVLFRLNQTKNRMFFVYSKERNGNYVLQVMDANSRTPLINAKLMTLEQFKNSEIVENLGNDEYKFNEEKLKEFLNKIELINKTEYNDFELVREVLEQLGIFVDSGTLEAMSKHNSSAYQSRIKDFLNQIKINAQTLSKITNNLEFSNPATNLINRDTAGFLSNLLGELIKFTFIVDQSMYVGGKTINTFSQPNFFTEQVRKLASLRGTDVKDEKNTLVTRLLKNGFTKNNMLVKLITRIDKNFGNLMSDSKEIVENLSVGYTSLEVLKRKGFKSNEQQITELSPSDFDTALMGYFGDMAKTLKGKYNGIPLRMAKMTSPTLSDSSQMFLMQTAVLDLSREHFTESAGRINGYNENIAEILYEQLILPELTRMLEVKGTERDTVANQLFYSVPSVNNIVSADGKNLLYYIRENNFSKEEMIKNVRDFFGTKIDEEIRKLIQSEVDDKLNINTDGSIKGSWVEAGFISEDKGTYTSQILDKKYLDKKHGTGNVLSKTETAAWEYAIDYLLTQTQIQALFAGDIANYSKAKKGHFLEGEVGMPNTNNNTEEERLAVYNGIAKASSVNLSKRLKALISPGNRIAHSASKQYIQLMFDDDASVSKTYKEYLKTWYKNIPQSHMAKVDRVFELNDKIRELNGKANITEVEKQEKKAYENELNGLKKELSSIYPEISGYLNNVATDAQEYTTWKEHLEIAFNMGKISQEQFDRINKKLTEQSKGNFEGNKLTSEEKLIFQPMKPLHAGMYFRDMNNGENYQEFVYVKTSSFPLIPEMTKDLKLDNLRKNMEKLEDKQGKPVRAAYISGVKVGPAKTLANINQLLDNDNIEVSSDNYSVLDRENFSIQQEKPFKTDKHIENGERDDIGRGTQIEKFLLANGINKIASHVFPNLFNSELLSRLGITPVNGKVTGEELYKIYTELATEEQTLKRNLFLRSLDISEEDYQMGSVSSMEKLQAALSKRLSNRQDNEILELKYYVKNNKGRGKYYTKEEVERLNLEPVSAEFTFPIWLSPNARKFESVLNSMITNEFIKLRFPGNSFPVASEEGFVPNKTLADLTKEETKGIVFTDSYTGEGLLPERIENGIVKPAQVLIASKFRTKKIVNGKVVEELIDFNTPEYINPETGRIDSSKLPEEARRLFSFRIPSSAHQSGSMLEIVGFLPHAMGDLMIVPKEHTTKIGEDYDIDTRYTYSGNYIVNEDGAIRLLNDNDVPKYPREEIDRIYNEYKESVKALTQYIKERNPNRPSKENVIKSEIATTQLLLSVLKKNISENSEEIQALNEDLDRLINSLNENKEVLTPDKRAEIKQEIKDLYEGFLKEKEFKVEEYATAKKFFGTRLSVIENDLIGLYKSVYSSPSNDIQKLITTTINTEMAENTAGKMEAKINAAKENKPFSIYSYEHQKSILRLGASGKLGIGVHSNWVVWNGLVQQSEKPISLGVGEEIFDLSIGNFTSDGRLGRIDALIPRESADGYYKDFKPRKLSEINMENQNSSTDNQKLQIMGRRNENKYTINVFALMCNLGFDKDIVNINGVNTELLLPSLFINQPILRRYVELKEQYSSAFTEYTKDVEAQILEKLREEFANNVAFPVDKESGEIIPFFSDEDLQEYSKELTGQNLYDSLVNPVSQETQWAVFQNFRRLSSYSTNVNKVMQLMNIDKGLGVSYFNVMAKKDILIQEMNEYGLGIKNVESLFGDAPEEKIFDLDDKKKISELKKQGFIVIGRDKNTGEVILRKPNSPNSAKLLNSLSLGYHLWGNIFPFENKYLDEQITDILGDRAGEYTERDMEARYTILSAVREYIYSSTSFNLYDNIKDINQERRRLLMDEGNNESLASYLVRLKKLSATNPGLKEMFTKHFFKNLEFSINRKEPSIIKYNINSNNSFNKNLPHTELLLMSDSQDVLPAFNGDENYTYEKLIKDIAKYAMLTSTENGAIGFRNYIPMAVFKKYGFDKELHRLANINANDGKYFNMMYNGTLKTITSFIGTDKVIKDASGTYIEIPSSFSNKKEDLDMLIDNVNRNFGEDAKAVSLDSSNGRININIPVNETNKGRFIRQFFQHNPELAPRVSHTEIGLRNRRQVATTSQFKYNTGDVPPNFISIKGTNGENFLFELTDTDNLNNGTYKRINKLGGFGVTEYNTNAEVNTSMFDNNNAKATKPVNTVPVGKRNTLFSLPTSAEKAISLSELAERIENTNLPDTEEVRKLKSVVEAALEVADPETKIMQGNLPNGSPGGYNNTTNTIIIDSAQYGVNTKDRLLRTVAEELFHSITAREIGNFVNANETGFEVGRDSITIKASYLGTSNASVTKLVRLYKASAEALIKAEAEAKNITWIEAWNNIQDRYKANPRETDAYRLSNLNEFMAGVFTDESFRKKMAQVQFKETNKSVLQHIAEFVEKLLKDITNRVDGSISEETLNAVNEFISTIKANSETISKKISTSEMLETDDRANSLLAERKKVVSRTLGSISRSTRIKSVTVLEIKDSVSSHNSVIIPEGVLYGRRNTQEHFGNPFEANTAAINANKSLIQVATEEEALEKYIDWIMYGGLPEHEDRRQWMLEQFKSGELKGKNILTLRFSDNLTGADVLDHFINDVDWNDVKPTSKENTSDPEAISMGEKAFSFAPSENKEMNNILSIAPRNAEGKLLAPNGKVSNLTERQYAQVRTKSFKNWFGDWEKGLTIKQDNKSYYRGQYDEPIIDKDGNLILKGKKDSLYERAGYNIEKGVSATTDMKSADEYGINQRYAYEADIEDKYGELDQSWEKEQELNEVAEHGYYLIQFSKNISNKIINEAGEVKIIDDVVIPKGQYTIEHITDESIEILATSNNNASKVVDENGEPLAVYHGTNVENISIFDRTKISEEQTLVGTGTATFGNFFSDKHDDAKSFANVIRLRRKSGKATIYDVFLNIKNPMYFETLGDFRKYSSEKGHYNDNGDFISDVKLPKEYDGVIVKRRNSSDDSKEFVALSSNQVKSAIDNVGTFSTDNDNINYAPREINEIQKVYNSNSEISSIGTEKQYSEYLKRVFPNSVNKNIFYHGTNKEFDKFNSRSINNDVGVMNGIYLSFDEKYAKSYGKNVKRIIIDTRKPLVTEGSWTGVIDDETKKEVIDGGYDAIINEAFDNSAVSKFFDKIKLSKIRKEAIVFDNSQIHVLGSNEDIQGFKDYMKEKQYVSSEKSIDFSNFTEVKDDIFANCRI